MHNLDPPWFSGRESIHDVPDSGDGMCGEGIRNLDENQAGFPIPVTCHLSPVLLCSGAEGDERVSFS
jgi:hypothetical protein